MNPISVSLFSITAVVVAAASAGHAEDPLERLLASTNERERVQAREELKLSFSDLSTPELAARSLELERRSGEALRREDLSPELRDVLFEGLAERFLRTPRGRLGVVFASGQPRSGPDMVGVELLRIDERAHEQTKALLKPGDIIVEIDGVSLVAHTPIPPADIGIAFPNTSIAQAMLVSQVVGREPGDEVRLAVVRPLVLEADPQPQGSLWPLIDGRRMIVLAGPDKNAERLTFTITLIGAQRAADAQNPDGEAILRSAFRVWLRRRGIEPPATN